MLVFYEFYELGFLLGQYKFRKKIWKILEFIEDFRIYRIYIVVFGGNLGVVYDFSIWEFL